MFAFLLSVYSFMILLLYLTRIRSTERGICPIAAVCTVVEILHVLPCKPQIYPGCKLGFED